MDKNELMIKESHSLLLPKQTKEEPIYAVVKYERVDSAHYSFTYSFNEDFSFRMDETDHAEEKTDYVDEEFEEHVSESAKVYYSMAAASGILTGTLSMLHLSEEQLAGIEEFKEKNWKPLIVSCANLAGYKKSDYKGAAKYLFNRSVRTIQQDGKVKEVLSVLSSHPSLTGMVFSIVTQYCGKAVVLSENGKITFQKLPAYYTIGDTNAEKLVCALLYWLFYLAADEAASKRHIIDGLGLSKVLLKKIKEFANFSFMKSIPNDFNEAEQSFSNWLKKTIKGTELYCEQKDDESVHPLFAMMGIALNIAEDSFPVLLNECLVRSMYILLRICDVVKERDITSFAELYNVPAEAVMPTDERILSKMCLIASGTFAGANIAGAVLKGIKGKKVDGKKFTDTFFAELNVAGIGRFIFACAADSKYWGTDIRILLQRNSNNNDSTGSQQEDHIEEDSAFQSLLLDAIQARILYCLEAASVQYDIRHTTKAETAEKKSQWLDSWKHIIVKGIGATADLADKYFVENENLLYDGIFELAKDKGNWGWFYLLTQELALFKPYCALGLPEDKEYKKLKVESDYLRDQFIRRQTIATQGEVDSIVKSYSKYNGYVSGRTQNKIIVTGVAAIATVATGGLALTFAPGIAAAIAGEAVIGLHGAALTSASLAFVGGGSIAAGGLGMAGGTAIITGGGALIGLVSSGTASAAAVLLQTPSDYWVRQSSKLLTYCSCVLRDYLKDRDSISAILEQLDHTLTNAQQELNKVKAEKNDLDKDLIKKTEEYLLYLKKCRSELQKMAK